MPSRGFFYLVLPLFPSVHDCRTLCVAKIADFAGASPENFLF